MPGPISHLLAVQAKERESQRPRVRNPTRLVRPLPRIVADHGTRYSLVQRTQCLTLLSLGYSFKFVEDTIKIPEKTSRRILKKAEQRGYHPAEDPRILEHHVEDGARSGRPKEISDAVEKHLLDLVIEDRNGREKSSEVLAYESGISTSSTLRILHKNGFGSVKPTRKPGLNREQRKARLEFCLAHQHWTLEDWKNVIWSDETSVILTRRGSQRLWRRPDEGFERSVIRNRWKGFSEFMFWGCFSYDFKGPCHIWTPETAVERTDAEKEIKELNKELEIKNKEEWELNQRQLPSRKGRKPQWRFTEKTGKLVRRSKSGGIDWYRYNKVW